MTDYAWGVLTPALAIAGLALALGLAWLIIALARHIWAKTHYALMTTTKLAPNRARLQLKGMPADDRPEYLDAANQIRDALLESPRLHTAAGFGWRLVLIRDSRTEPHAEQARAETDH